MEKFIELFANLFDRNRYKRIYSSDKIQRIGRVEFAYRFIGHTDGR